MMEQGNSDKGRTTAMGLGGAVYVGVIIAATTLNITFILLAFPETAFLTRTIMVIASVLVGLSMVAFPITLHKWAVSGSHRWITIFFYYGEMAVIAINTIVSFSTLLYKFAGAQIPSWIGWYEPYSIISIIYTLLAWGTIFLTDPRARQEAKIKDAQERFNNQVAQQLTDFLGTVEGKAAVQARANQLIGQHYSPIDQSPKYWNGQPEQQMPMAGGGGGGGGMPAPQQQQYPQQPQYPQLPQYPQQPHQTFWNLAAWLNFVRMDGASAYQFLASYNLTDGNPATAYQLLQPAGYMPADMPYVSWPGIYGDLLRTYGPQAGPGYPIAPPQFAPVKGNNQNPPPGSVR